MNVDKFIRDAAQAVDRWTDKELSSPPSFGGKPGTPVPEVDPEDLKVVWEVCKQMGPGAAIDTIIFERLCKPGADVQAVCHRSRMLCLVAMLIQTQQLAPNKDGTLDMKVFKAAAKVPLEWMETGVVKEFDVESFFKLCEAGV